MEKTKATNNRILNEQTRTKGTFYTNPEMLSGNIQTQVRDKKEADSKLRADLTAKVRYEQPRASEEVVNATVTRLIYEKELADRTPEDTELTLKPNMKKTLKTEVTIERYHTGVWEVSKFSKKGKYAWSCCQSKDENDPGCAVRKIDKKRWNVDGLR